MPDEAPSVLGGRAESAEFVSASSGCALPFGCGSSIDGLAKV
jgi:hypothetical protein